ncbi:MAG: pyridoxine 5'-phosphate synthase [Lacunisphaera sp.]
MILLGVNIDHVATLRQARYRQAGATHGGAVEPDPVELAFICEKAGADGITVHLREDRRHMQDEDVRRLAAHSGTRLNLEMACTPAMTALALELRPHSVCLVPESREEITTEGGLDVVKHREKVATVTDAMNAAGIKTSLFIDPDPEQIEMAAKLQAPWVELHTGAYANAYYGTGRAAEFARLVKGAQLGNAAGLVVNAGHGINYVNIAEVRAIPHLHELNIGHSIVSRALTHGLAEAVGTMKRLMNPLQ